MTRVPAAPQNNILGGPSRCDANVGEWISRAINGNIMDFTGYEATLSASSPNGDPYLNSASSYRAMLAPRAEIQGEASQSQASGCAPCTVARQPLRVIHIGSYLFGAGIENWQVALVKYADPRRLRFIRSVVTTNLVDQGIVQRLGIPVAIGGRDAVRQAAIDADVLLVSGPAQVGEWLADMPRPPTVFVAHGDGIWTREIYDAVRPQIDHIVAVSHHVKKSIGAELPTTVIHNAVDPAHLTISRSRQAMRASLGFGPRDFVLGFVGRFSPEKNALALIEAIERLPPNFKLLLVGFGVQRHELLDQAARKIHGRYAFAEAQDQLGDYYQAMDTLCLPSTSEGYGLVLMEAMLCGRPVISAPVGFAPESLTNRVNGLIVSGDPASFARAAQLLQAHPYWRKAIAQEGQRFAQNYGLPHRMTAKYADLLEGLHAQCHGLVVKDDTHANWQL